MIGPPGTPLENSPVFREAMDAGLAPHLIIRAIQNRLTTTRSTYLHLKDLVEDLFHPTDTEEVPMETDQLEEALMMSSPVVKMALRMGAPPHLIKSLVWDKIFSNGVGYGSTHELITDVYEK